MSEMCSSFGQGESLRFEKTEPERSSVQPLRASLQDVDAWHREQDPKFYIEEDSGAATATTEWQAD